MAGTGDGQDGGGLIQGINVTPFVDIVLVLLVIFMVTARLVFAPSTAIPLDLPKASKGDAVQTVLSLSLKADGALFANGQPLQDEVALETLARAEHQKDAALSVVIQADGDVAHRRVIRVMDALGRAGVAKIAFGVEVVPGATPAAPSSVVPGATPAAPPAAVPNTGGTASP